MEPPYKYGILVTNHIIIIWHKLLGAELDKSTRNLKNLHSTSLSIHLLGMRLAVSHLYSGNFIFGVGVQSVHCSKWSVR